MNSTTQQVKITLSKKPPVHIIGGGGVGMSALAILLMQSGFKVSASDLNGGVYLDNLKSYGAIVWVGHNPKRINENSVVFHSSAIPETDEELTFAKLNNKAVYSRHFLLNFITEQYYTIAISGTHGKTTTTAWIAKMLIEAGQDPSAYVGGTVLEWNSNIRIGKGEVLGKPLLVIEADESDESFLYIDADEVIITNVELDHVDRYDSSETLEDKFFQFAQKCRKKNGLVVLSSELLEKKHKLLEHCTEELAVLEGIKINEGKQSLEQNIIDKDRNDNYDKSIYADETSQKITYEIGLSGRYNLWNASAVLAHATLKNIPVDIVRKSLLEFSGVGRRLQKLCEEKIDDQNSFTVIDDYAHHPTEVKEVLKTLVETYDKVIPVWEPHRVSRFLHFRNDFIRVFEESNLLSSLYLLPVFDAALESKEPRFSHYNQHIQEFEKISSGGLKRPHYVSILYERMSSQAGHNVIVFMGAGHSTGYAKEFAKHCQEQKVSQSNKVRKGKN